ncbi:hypothetical protein FHR75_000210 [Kineococcus radiotolerans]|uniref:Uncharacterized protein n=1 Tax=Kineococcus radiotolerans TaxID=131568 RepID=A0A7W4TIA6_KINRA|nr:hypothetical protein [Kineococcus radiotolerans]
MNTNPVEGGAVDETVGTRRPRHPLQQPGAGRALYAAGLTVQLAGLLCLLSVLLPAALDTLPVVSPVPAWAPLAGIAMQFGGQRFCARAWWYVPLRSAEAAPDAVELLFWSLNAVAVVTVAAVVAFVPPVPDASSLWLLVVAAAGLALLPEVARPTPEPPAAQTWRAVPLGAAALLVLGLGLASGAFTTTAVLGAVAALGAGCVATRAWSRRRSR